jgi:hypothetical protein
MFWSRHEAHQNTQPESSMKAIIFAALSLFATSAVAADISGIRQAHSVQVKSVQVDVTGPWALHNVQVVAVFGNPCTVATADELVVMSDYQDNFDALVLSLGNLSDRVCTMEYAPVEVTIDLGTYGRPNDGVFGKVVVNGIEQVIN